MKLKLVPDSVGIAQTKQLFDDGYQSMQSAYCVRTNRIQTGQLKESMGVVIKRNQTKFRNNVNGLSCRVLRCPIRYWYWEKTQFMIHASHKALQSVLKVSDATGKPARWWISLLEMSFDVVNLIRMKVQRSRVSLLDESRNDNAPVEDKITKSW